MVESFVYLGIKNVNDNDLCFSDIVVACNTYGGKNLCSDLLLYGWTELQTKNENILALASFT
jgi:hypothetical protein